jgi:tetratricopeptide (TPR) repeat protein
MLVRCIRTAARGKEALANARTPIEKGEQLLGWLYGKTGPIGPVGSGKHKKYVAKQTSLAVLLDTGTYNCVSSAVVYNVIGRRLGLDLRAIESPDHVFPVLYDGEERVDVETTTPRGFNPLRDKAAQKEFAELTGFTYIPARHRKKQREIDEAALVAAIYYNRGVEFGRENRYREALRVNICALSLDPRLAAAADNARAALVDWAGEALREGKVDLALDIIRQNVEWLKDPLAEVKLIMAAYDSRGRQLRKDKDWPGMANLYTTAFKRHRNNTELAKHFENNALAAYDDWAKPFLKSEKWREAVKVYEQGLKDLGDNKHLQHQLKYCQQQHAK